jgi:hypothetical protein
MLIIIIIEQFGVYEIGMIGKRDEIPGTLQFIQLELRHPGSGAVN